MAWRRSVEIKDLNPGMVLASALIPMQDPATGVSYKVSIAELAAYVIPLLGPGGSTVATTATTPTPTPSGATVGTAITGLSSTIAPSGTTVYAALHDGTAQVGNRVAFSTSSIPSLTPATANGTHTVRIYAAATGGTALATSATFTVAAGLAAPNAVSNLVGVASTQSTTRINLSWTESGGAPTTRTVLIRPSGSGTYNTAEGFWSNYGGGIEGVTINGTYQKLTPSTAYDVQVILSNSAGTSPAATLTNVSTAAVATAATAPVPTPSGAVVNVEISGLTSTITPVGGIAYAALHDGTAEVGFRYPFGGTAVRALTPTTAGANYTIRIYAGPFTTPVLATSATFTVAAAASGQTITFAGAAGPGTGNQVMVAGPGGDLSGAGLNGSGSLRLQDAPGKSGIFQNYGVKGDGTMTVLFADGTTNRSISLVLRASATALQRIHIYINEDTANVYDGVSSTSLGTFARGDPSLGYSVVLSGTTVTVKANDTTIGVINNCPVTGTGYIGLGAGSTPGALIKSVSFT